MSKKIFIFLFLISPFMMLFSQRKSIAVSQLDSRFTLTVERSGGSAGGYETYYFYVQNNTNREYRLVIHIDLDLSCGGMRSFVLGSNSSVHLDPNGRFLPSADYVRSYPVQKDCAIPTANKDYTIYKRINYSYSSIVDLTKEKEEANAKKKEVPVPQKTVPQPIPAVIAKQPSSQGTVENTTKQTSSSPVYRPTVDYAKKLEAERQYQNERTQIINKGVSDLGNLIGGFMQQNQANKERARALEEEREERQRQLEYELFIKRSNRKAAFAKLPPKDIPLSSQEKASSIYFFIYAYNNLDSEYAATASISNVFEIGSYEDGTRAYTSRVKEEIAGLTPFVEVLHGYYYTAQEAEQFRQELMGILHANGVRVNTIFYKGKISASQTGSSTNVNYGTMIGAPAKMDTRPNNGTAPNSAVDKFKENQTKKYGTIIK